MKRSIDNLFWNALAILLLGYATLGRGFAYMGVPPLYVGEIVLILGVSALCMSLRRFRLPNTPALWLMGAFVLWCIMRTLPFVGRYGADALRDSAIWLYCIYAVIVVSLIVHDPQRIVQLLQRYAKFVWLLMILAPMVLILQKVLKGGFPKIPGTDVEILALKGGDACVHLTAAFAFLSLFVPISRSWPAALLMPINLAVNLLVRAGLVTFALGAVVLTIFRPKNPLLYRTLLAGVAGVGLMWAMDVRIRPDKDNPREVSVDQLVRNVTSLFGYSRSEALDGSKEWRMNWWSDIIQYTVHGPYFWTGKGFGINLANADGYQVYDDGSLRSPHNGHMTLLARAGVPGLALWLATQLAWLATIAMCFLRATQAGQKQWANLFLVFMIYWLAFHVNASFDVFLEGPMGGIWFWSVFGAGMAAVQVHQKHPELLPEVDNEGARLVQRTASSHFPLPISHCRFAAIGNRQSAIGNSHPAQIS